MLTYTLGEILLGYTPRPVPVNGEVLCRCKYNVVKPGDDLCEQCEEDDAELYAATLAHGLLRASGFR